MARHPSLMEQYEALKKEHPEAILLFRLGDFYETFGADAELASRELGIALTTRDRGKETQVPLAGVPHHALDTYLARLIAKGYKVAICEQLGTPSGRGLVERRIVRVVTPGTVMEEALLDGRLSNYLMSVFDAGDRAGIALADTSTGELRTLEVDKGCVAAEIARVKPAEILVPEGSNFPRSEDAPGTIISWYRQEAFEAAAAIAVLRQQFPGLAQQLSQDAPALVAAGAALAYMREMQKGSINQFTTLLRVDTERRMMLDRVTLRNLEVLENIRDGGRDDTLLSVLDRTHTKAGARTLYKWLAEPLLSPEDIRKRQDAVDALLANPSVRDELLPLLRDIRDMERLVSRSVYGSANPRELVELAASLACAKDLRHLITSWSPASEMIKEIGVEIEPCDPLVEKVKGTLNPDPPSSLDAGGVIRTGCSEELDKLREAKLRGKEWIVRFEAQERQRTGIRSLRVGYTRVFGYYIEITKPNLARVPQNYERRQTVASGERFTTPELKEMEAQVLSAEERSIEMEREIFKGLCGEVARYAAEIQRTAKALGRLDALASFAEAAERNRYVRPVVLEGDEIKIIGGRHPVVEGVLGERFVPNDAILDAGKSRLLIITGPNMAGKSTFMRQVALIVLMAQVGSFVPARSAKLGIVDRIFTRVGAYDDLARGQSTFMTEMVEVAEILRHATQRSLILLDEIGRGTSTYDGMSLACAVAEYIHSRRIGAKTMFATHYHDLTALEEVLLGVANHHIAVKEDKEGMVFLYKVIPGSTNRSYGIHVAALAGIPAEVITRSKDVLKRLEEGAGLIGNRKPRGWKRREYTQLVLFEQRSADSQITTELKALKVEEMTPLEALVKLQELKRKVEHAE
ncbi:MAG: DNA mismatch repair protein MutS [Candidatus Thermoplasmatota archaeon]